MTRDDTGAQVFPRSGVLTIDTDRDPGIDGIAIGDPRDGTFEVLTREPPEAAATAATGVVNALPGRTVDVAFDGVTPIGGLSVG